MRRVWSRVAILFSVIAFSTAQGADNKSVTNPGIRVLTYESMLGKHGLGKILESEYSAQNQGARLEFVKVSDLSGILGRLRQDKRKNVVPEYQYVLGLDERMFVIAKEEGLIEGGVAYDQSLFAVIVDTQKLSENKWPKSWKDLSVKLSGNLLIEDPRLSSPGIGWLRTIYDFKLLNKKSAAQAVKRVFPSWTAAYGAFTEGEGVAVWSYLGSEAYHLCNEKPENRTRYRALPLEEGYPKQVEYLGRMKSSSVASAASQDPFEKVLLSKVVQDKIYTTQWMFPVSQEAVPPDCFKGLSVLKEIKTPSSLNAKSLQSWIDDWAL